MEDKLLAYRRQQQRQLFFENIKIRLRNMINPPRKDPEVKISVDVDQESIPEDDVSEAKFISSI